MEQEFMGRLRELWLKFNYYMFIVFFLCIPIGIVLLILGTFTLDFFVLIGVIYLIDGPIGMIFTALTFFKP
jgi:hypothetical protein